MYLKGKALDRSGLRATWTTTDGKRANESTRVGRIRGMSIFSALRTTPGEAGPKDPPLSLADVLEDELKHLHGSRPPIVAPALGEAAAVDPQERLDRMRRDMNAHGHSALCLSGGGIRSASFALGVIQGLAHKGLLGSFDYLSTVSGGGFTGGWLAAWLYRVRDQGPGAVTDALAGTTRAADAVEPGPVRRMRTYSRYMSPQAGFLSADGWTLGATILRNLILNWTVLLPLVAATLMLPLIYRELITALYLPPNSANTITLTEPSTYVLAASVTLILFGLGFIAFNLPGAGDRRCSERDFLRWCHVPVCIGILGLTLYWAMEDVEIRLRDILLANTIGQSLTWIPVNLVMRARRWRPRTLVALAISGAVTSVPLWALTQLFQDQRVMVASYLVLAFPLLMLIVDLVVVLFVGLAGADIGDSDLEWYSRLAAWDLITVVSWLLIGAIVFYVPALLDELRDSAQNATGFSTLGATGVVILGILTPVAGAGLLIRVLTSGGRLSGARQFGLAAAGPTLVLLLLGSLAWANTNVLSHMRQDGLIATRGPGFLGTSLLPEAVVVFLCLTLFGLMTSRLVRVNKFSLPGMYRERLTRAFLGASRIPDERLANPFTGFDPADDIEIGKLAAVTRPILVVNMTLNKIGRASLAGLYRKAVSFTATSLHTGSASLGYRSSAEYGSNPAIGQRGISLGTAMTISGAAASPNMGTFSSPLLTFLLTMFNARLGAWLGNPASAGAQWRRGEPRHNLAPLLSELIGRTTDDSPYVYLSDGGHFENLGLYEMVLRRCRYILVIDAGCDPTFTFHDLANAIRQVRIDMGVPIVFDRGIGIGETAADRATRHYAVATIQYSAIDGRKAEDGLLVYVKPAVSGDEPVDVLTYRRARPLFPHEPTADQWFDEAQFESYRALGFHSVLQIADPHTGPFRLAEFFAAARTEALRTRETAEVHSTPATVLGTV